MITMCVGDTSDTQLLTITGGQEVFWNASMVAYTVDAPPSPPPVGHGTDVVRLGSRTQLTAQDA